MWSEESEKRSNIKRGQKQGMQQEAARSNVSVSIKTFCFSPALFHITFVPIGVGVASISAGLHESAGPKSVLLVFVLMPVGKKHRHGKFLHRPNAASSWLEKPLTFFKDQSAEDDSVVKGVRQLTL